VHLTRRVVVLLLQRDTALPRIRCVHAANEKMIGRAYPTDRQVSCARVDTGITATLERRAPLRTARDPLTPLP
jgi:hypothetical protein